MSDDNNVSVKKQDIHDDNQHVLKNKPLVFFKDNNYWKSVKLSDCAEINPKSLELPNVFYYIDLESVKNGILTKHNLINLNDAPSRAQRLLKENDILFQLVRPYQKNNLYFSEKGKYHYVASTGYAQIRSKIYSKFLYQLLHTEKFLKEVLRRCTGTSYPAINSNDLKSIKVNIPNSKVQKLIGDFLFLIDRKIDLLEKKLCLMKKFKKNLLNTIFSNKHSKNNKNDWKIIKINQMGTFTNGVGFKKKYQGYENFSIPFFKISDMNLKTNKKYMIKSNNTVNNKICNELRIKPIMKPSIIFAKIGAAIYLERKRIVKKPFLIDNNMLAFQVDKKFDLEFVYYLFLNIKFSKYAQLTALPSITQKDIGNIKCLVPNIIKQKNISNSLILIDEKIKYYENKIFMIKQFKKGLLQKMFV